MFKTNSNGNLYYSESISRNYKNLPLEFKFLLHAWQNQRKRCYNKNDKRYNNYGAKGICIEYSLRELIGWYWTNKHKFSYDQVVIGRIDHDKNYSLKNIRLETKSFSSKERLERCGPINPRKNVKIKYSDGREEIFSGIVAVSKYLNIGKNTAIRYLDKSYTSKRKYAFILERCL